MDRNDLGVHTRADFRQRHPPDRGRRHHRRAQDSSSRARSSWVSCWARSKLFDFVDNNPLFEFHPSSYTNDPFLIARNDNMVAINSALQIDLTGQVCSDSIGN